MACGKGAGAAAGAPHTAARGDVGGAAAGLKALSDDLMPALFKHNGLSSDTDVGTVNGKPAPWTRLVLQKLVQYPPLAKEMMVKLRRVLGCWSQRSVCVDTLVRANSGDYLRLRVCVTCSIQESLEE